MRDHLRAAGFIVRADLLVFLAKHVRVPICALLAVVADPVRDASGAVRHHICQGLSPFPIEVHCLDALNPSTQI